MDGSVTPPRCSAFTETRCAHVSRSSGSMRAAERSGAPRRQHRAAQSRMASRAEPIGVLPIVDVRGQGPDGRTSGFVDALEVKDVTGRLVAGGARLLELRAKHSSR